MNRLLHSLALFAAIVFLFAIPATSIAATDMFIKFEDPNIKGESQDEGHSGEIEVLSWSWGTSMVLDYTAGGARPTRASFVDFSFTKFVDRASVPLFQAAVRGSHFGRVIFTVRKAVPEPIDYFILTMEDVLVTSLSSGGSGGDNSLTENVSLNYGKITLEYVPLKIDGTGDASIVFGWDIEQNTEK